jgi:hypothetical protein
MIDAMIKDLGLRNTGLTNDLHEAMQEVLHRYPEDFAPFGEHRPPRREALWSMARAIKHWLGGITVAEEESDIITQQVPLCVITSPDLPGAKATYGETMTQEDRLGWKIEISGTGFGADVTVVVKQTSEFISSSGDRKLIFAPLKMRVAKVSLYKLGYFQESFLKAELAETEVREANGIRDVSTIEWQELTREARVIDRFDLLGDTSGDVAKYKRSYTMKGSFESKLGLKLFNLEASIVAKCDAEHTAEVVFELPAGRKYELWEPSSIFGFFFGP